MEQSKDIDITGNLCLPIEDKRMCASSNRATITPSVQEEQVNEVGSKSTISPVERSDMTREVYQIIQYNLPQSIKRTTNLPQLILISRAIERKIFESAPSYEAYLNPNTLNLRISALACAVLIHSETGNGSSSERSYTCSRLVEAARTSLPHSVMVLVSYETRKLDEGLTSFGEA